MPDWRYRRNWLDCTKCRHYKKATPNPRCKHPDNLRNDWIGTVYMKCPEHRNWNGKCEWYEEIKNANSKK